MHIKTITTIVIFKCKTFVQWTDTASERGKSTKIYVSTTIFGLIEMGDFTAPNYSRRWFFLGKPDIIKTINRDIMEKLKF